MSFFLSLCGCDGTVLGGTTPFPPIVPAITPVEPVASCSGTRLLQAKLWRLSETQIRNSYRAVLGSAYSDTLFTPLRDGKSSDQQLRLFASNLGFDGPQVVTLLGSVEAIAEVAMKNRAALSACRNDACVDGALAGLASELWRRPSTADELTPYTKAYTSARGLGGTHEESLTTAVTALLMSPRFMYRFETGAAPTPGTNSRLTAFELATFLSMALTDAPPDAALLASAHDGSLLSDSVFRQHAERLMNAQAARRKLVTVIDDWLGYGEVAAVKKDPELLTTLTPELRSDLRTESDLLVEHVAFERRGTVKDLLSFEGSFVNQRVASHYGMPSGYGATFASAPMGDAKRKGILTHGAFISAFSSPGGTGMTHRANFILSHLLCSPLPPAPANAAALLPMRQPNERLTTRQRMEMLHSSKPGCNGCHRILDPIGGSFESFDSIGRYRETEYDLPVDSSGKFEMLGLNFEFQNTTGFVEQLAQHPALNDCFVKKSFAVLTGELPSAENTCEVARFKAATGQNNDQVASILTAVEQLASAKERWVAP
jgi:hypothetical protein